MRVAGPVGIIAAVFVSSVAVNAGTSPHAGDTYEITLIRETVQQGSNGSSGDSHDKDTIIERVMAVRADGLELEYDLPKSPAGDACAETWQFPARVFKPFHGTARLLNGPELEARIDKCLKAANWPRTICGHWIFTWNAFRIECDPQSVIQAIDVFDLKAPDLVEGAPYQTADARSPGRLVRKTGGPDGSTFAVEMPVDPVAVHHARAESDLVAGEILKRPVTLDAALRERSKEMVSGTISVTFEADSDGSVRRRTKVTKLEIKEPDGQSETETATETLERRRVLRQD